MIRIKYMVEYFDLDGKISYFVFTDLMFGVATLRQSRPFSNNSLNDPAN